MFEPHCACKHQPVSQFQKEAVSRISRIVQNIPQILRDTLR